MALLREEKDGLMSSIVPLYEQVVAQNIQGPDVEKMKAVLQRMEEITDSASDLIEASGLFTQENLYMEFSQAYSSALMKQSQNESSSNGIPTDEQFRMQEKNALEQSAREIKKMLNQEDQFIAKLSHLQILKSLNEQLELLQNTVNYPQYLVACIQKGYHTGTGIKNDQIQSNVQLHELRKTDTLNPYTLEKHQLEANQLKEAASKNPYQIVEGQELEFIDYDSIIKTIANEKRWDYINEFADEIFTNLSLWALSQTNVAEQFEPYNMITDPVARKKSIEEDKATLHFQINSMIKEYQRLFGYHFDQHLHSDSFKTIAIDGQINFPEEYLLHFMTKIYSAVKKEMHVDVKINDETAQFFLQRKTYKPRKLISAFNHQNKFIEIYGKANYEKIYNEFININEIERYDYNRVITEWGNYILKN